MKVSGEMGGEQGRPVSEDFSVVVDGVRYRPLMGKMACPPCRRGECSECALSVPHPQAGKYAAGDERVMCACAQGDHAWRPRSLADRRPR